MKHALAKGGILSVAGNAEVKVRKGKVQVVGADLKAPARLHVPEGKRVPFEALVASELEVEAAPEKVEQIAARTIPREWDAFVDRVIREKARRIIVLGEMDTGKSFFTTYVSNRLLSKRISVAALDCDIGQSDIGPPGCFGLLVMKKASPFLFQQPPTDIAMVGAHSPGLHFLPTVTAFHRLIRAGLEKARTVIVNTNGWVQGDGGRALKRTKLELFEPDLIVLMQRKDELEHLVRREPKKKVVRMAVSRKASFTPPDERKKLREKVSMAYMAGAKLVTVRKFATEGVFYGTGSAERFFEDVPGLVHAERLSGWEGWLLITKLPLANAGDLMQRHKVRIQNAVAGVEREAMVALLDVRGDCLGLGSVESIDFARRTAKIWTPVKKTGAIHTLQFSSLRLTREGAEAGFMTPGIL